MKEYTKPLAEVIELDVDEELLNQGMSGSITGDEIPENDEDYKDIYKF